MYYELKTIYSMSCKKIDTPTGQSPYLVEKSSARGHCSSFFHIDMLTCPRVKMGASLPTPRNVHPYTPPPRWQRQNVAKHLLYHVGAKQKVKRLLSSTESENGLRVEPLVDHHLPIELAIKGYKRMIYPRQTLQLPKFEF